MARTVQEEEHAARTNQILDAAQSLIYTKGYEQMTIQDILDAAQCSKGALYHYFESKQSLLEALIHRMVDQMLSLLRPVVEDQQLSATEKLMAVSSAAAVWKTERIDLLAALLETWYAEDNALVREKLNRESLEKMQPLYQAIVEQGIASGEMATPYPDFVGMMLMNLMQTMSTETMRCLMTWNQWSDGPQRLARCIAAHSDAIERLLGMTYGGLQLVDPTVLHRWGEVLSRTQSAREAK